MEIEQNLTEKQRARLEWMTDMYRAFLDANRAHLDEIDEARKFRMLEDPNPNNPTDLKYQLNTLNSTIDNVVADQMDNTPEATLMPERDDLTETADNLTDLVRWVLHRAEFDLEYSDIMEDVTVTGTGIAQIFYDDDLEIGEYRGNVAVTRWKPENFLPDPGYDDIQDARCVFKVVVHPLDWFKEHYPDESEYIEPDADTMAPVSAMGNKQDARRDREWVALIECWRRVWSSTKRRYLIHMSKFAGGALLYDSEEEMPDGVYSHGMYPFVIFNFRKSVDSVFGNGMYHEFVTTQRLINQTARYIVENTRMASRPKLIVNKAADIDVEKAADFEQDVLEGARTTDDGIRWFTAPPLNSLCMNMLGWLQDSEKQDSGQNQFSRGEGGLGVTAASAIQSLQEAGGKTTRMHLKHYMQAYRKVVEQVLALMMQFFTKERTYLITGEAMELKNTRRVQVSAKQLSGGKKNGNPAYTVRVQVQKANPNKISEWNQMVTEAGNICAQAGTPIRPSVLLAMYKFDGKDDIVKMLEDNDQFLEQMQQMQQQIEQANQVIEQMQQGQSQLQQENEAQKQIIGTLGGGQGSVMPSSDVPDTEYNGMNTALGIGG